MTDTMTKTSGKLIAADKVVGTNVYSMKGDKIGNIDELMIDKASGRAIYAVMTFGGFLGMGEEQYPLPWASLKYDTDKDGYMVNVDKKQLESAPKYAKNAQFKWTSDYGRTVDSYYNVPSQWL